MLKSAIFIASVLNKLYTGTKGFISKALNLTKNSLLVNLLGVFILNDGD